MTANNTIRADGTAELATTFEAAKHVWQGENFGARFVRGAKVEEIAALAGLDWRVQRAKVRYATGRDQGADAWATDDNNHVLMRSDTKAMLGIVSAKFKVANPMDLLNTLIFDARAEGFEIESAGTLHGGRVVFASASDGTEGTIGAGDTILCRTLLATSMDGTRKTTGHKVSIATVCENTLRMAMAGGEQRFALSHRSRYDAHAARLALGLIHDTEGFESFMDGARRLADKQVSKDRAERLLLSLLAPEVEAKGAAATLPELEKVTESLAFRKILDLFNGAGKGATLDGRKGTAWGWLNAITEYADHHTRATSDDNRRDSAWFGKGDALKQKALALVAA